MTDEKALISQIHSLPDNLKAEVARFVEKLKSGIEPIPVKNFPRRPKAGSMPGFFKVGPDFDDPIPGFEEYT